MEPQGALESSQTQEPPLAGVTELKRMFVRPAHRGHGFARDLLTQLEGVATAAGIRRLRLETGTAQHAALALYRSSGYADIPAYGELRR